MFLFITYFLAFIAFVLIFFEIKSLFIFFLIRIAEFFNINLYNYEGLHFLLEKLTYNFYVWKIFFDVSLFISLLFFLLFLYFLIYQKRIWQFNDSFYMLLPLSGMAIYIALWPGFFDINFFNFVSLDFLEKNIKTYYNLLLIYEMKGFNLIEFLYEDTHFISKLVVFNTYFFYIIYLLLILFIITDKKINNFLKILYIYLLSFFVNSISFIFIEIFYYFSIIPYKIIYDENLQLSLYNSMNYINAFLLTF